MASAIMKKFRLKNDEARPGGRACLELSDFAVYGVGTTGSNRVV
jgi:hypothetical protein